jgi:hypothetical protein
MTVAAIESSQSNGGAVALEPVLGHFATRMSSFSWTSRDVVKGFPIGTADRSFTVRQA